MSSARPGRPTGRNIGGGLPSNPRARSAGHSDGRERERKEYPARSRDSDHHPRHNTGTPTRAPPTRPVRPQRSAASILPSRGTSSSYTDVPVVPPLPVPRRSDISSKSSASSGSYSSAASGSSSTFLDRMKGGRGYGSSRTSLEDEADPAPRKAMGPERGGWIGQRRTAAMPESEYSTCLAELGCRGVRGSRIGVFRRNGRWKRVVGAVRLRLVTLVTGRNRCEHFDYKRVKGMGV